MAQNKKNSADEIFEVARVTIEVAELLRWHGAEYP
jgi:hypothetical protein